MMLLIKNFTNFKINEKFLRRAEKEAIENIPAIKKIADLEIDLAIAGEKRMRRLNRTWRGKDRVTDVLSFGNQKPIPSNRDKNPKVKFIFAPNNIFHLGEIIVCYPSAVKQARESGHSLGKEMAVLLIHGILHLAGYNHEKSASEARKMFGLQEKIAGKIRE